MRALALAIVLVTGCAENAILEVELMLPPASGAVRHVFVQTRSGEAEFEATWSGSGSVDGIVLADGAPSRSVVSVEADDGAELDAPLSLKIRYCTTERCTEVADSDAQEVWVSVERAFYEGRYTQLEVELPAVGACSPPCATELSFTKCQVRGCRAGDTVMYCDRDGRHFCEE